MMGAIERAKIDRSGMVGVRRTEEVARFHPRPRYERKLWPSGAGFRSAGCVGLGPRRFRTPSESVEQSVDDPTTDPRAVSWAMAEDAHTHVRYGMEWADDYAAHRGMEGINMEQADWVYVERSNQQFAAELRKQVRIVRDIIGNPFRPVTFSSDWLTSTATAIAQQMYEPRDFSAMPILAGRPSRRWLRQRRYPRSLPR